MRTLGPKTIRTKCHSLSQSPSHSFSFSCTHTWTSLSLISDTQAQWSSSSWQHAGPSWKLDQGLKDGGEGMEERKVEREKLEDLRETDCIIWGNRSRGNLMYLLGDDTCPMGTERATAFLCILSASVLKRVYVCMFVICVYFTKALTRHLGNSLWRRDSAENRQQPLPSTSCRL